jgi:tRNA(Ile)-lysidine synthase
VAALPGSVAATRLAVRRALRDVRVPGAADSADAADAVVVTDAPPLVLVAGSGGPDSLALAAAAGFVAPRMGWRAGLLTVDHGLQAGSAQRARRVADRARRAGLDPVEVLTARVASRPGGPEAAARAARYEALAAAAARLGAAAVLLGHTRDDQAETVLLALARGAGPRGLAGMPARRDAAGVAWLRPLLALPRAQVHDACRAQSLQPWLDPHNVDAAYARARVRHTALPALTRALGERVVDNLARTAGQLAADTAALDGWAAQALADARVGDRSLRVAAVQDLPEAVRTRVLHGWAKELGAPGSALSHRHVAALDALVTGWRGQGATYLPGGWAVCRRAGLLTATAPTVTTRGGAGGDRQV